MNEIYFAGGCFWGTEHFFKQIDGVIETQVGFANGKTKEPTYNEVYTDETGHAETVRVVYDENIISLTFLVNLFFKTIDPTLLNRQGNDVGTRYRTGIYYTDECQQSLIQKVFEEQQKHYDTPIVVELLPLQCFYAAEEYHQDYLTKKPQGYCHIPFELFEYARNVNCQQKSN